MFGSIRSILRFGVPKKLKRETKQFFKTAQINFDILESRLAPTGNGEPASVLTSTSLQPKGTVQFTTSSKSVAEGCDAQTVAVSLTGTGILAQNVIVPISTPSGTAKSDNGDYTLTTKAVTFPAGTRLSSNPTQNVKFTIGNDKLVEGTESFTLKLGSITAPGAAITLGAVTSNAVTITDDDSATVSISSGATLTEGGAAIPITATLRVTTDGIDGGSATLAAGVTAKLPGNSDYSSTTASFAAGAGNNAISTIMVAPMQDTLLEENETFTNQMVTVTGAATVSGSGQTIKVNDDESATLSIAAASSVSEGGGAQPVGPVTLTINGKGTGTFALGNGISISADVRQTGGTATSGTDYKSFGTQTVTFGAGAATGATKQATMTVIDDGKAEGNETVLLTLRNLESDGTATKLGSTANTTIIADDIADDTVSATIVGSNLVVADSSVPGKNNAFKISVNGGNIVVGITDGADQFVSAPTGWTLSADKRSISHSIATLTGSIKIDAGAGDDKFAVDGGGVTSAVYTPDSSITGNGVIDLSNGPFGSGVHFSIGLTNFEPVDISGMLSATVMSPANPTNAFVLNAGFDSATGTHPAIVASGVTGTGLKGIEAAHLFNNTNVTIDSSATTGLGSNTITVGSAIALGHNNTNLTLLTNANGSVTVNYSLAVAGSLSVVSPSANMNAHVSAAVFNGTATTANLSPGSGLQDAINVAANGATLFLSPGTYSGNTVMSKPFTLNVASGTATISGNLSGVSGLTKAGDGALVLSGINTYLGNTSITRGRLQISNDNQLGNAASILTASTPGLLEFTGNTASSRTIFLNNNAILQVDSGKTLTLSGAEINGGFITGPGAIATTGSKSTSFNGTRATNSLTLTVNSDAAFTSFNNGGVLNLAAAKTFTMTSFTNGSSGKMFVNGTANVADFVSDGQITVASTGSMVNIGSSRLTFGSGSITTVNGVGPIDNINDGLIQLGSSSALLTGGLMLNSGLVGSSTPGVSLIVDFGALAKGAGLYGSVITQNGGRFSPGSSPGAATASNFTVNGGGTYQFEIANATGTAGASSGWDQLIMVPSVFNSSPKANFSATPSEKFNIKIVSLVNSGDHTAPGPIDNFDPHRSYSWTFIDASNRDVTVTGTFDPAAFNIDTTDFTNSVAGTFAVASNDSGKTVSIVYTPTPVSTPNAPQVLSVIPNGGAPGLAGAQRSRVVNMTVVFDQAVQLDANAITLALHTKNVSFNGVLQPSGFGVLPTSLNFATIDNITWTITFSGNTDVGADGLSSLRDGVYDLAIDATKVHLSGSTAVSMAANSTTTFHRLFGDTGAPATASGIDFSAIVNTGDNLQFRGAFNNAATYNALLDFNGDGTINSGDNLQFRNRFNKSLTWTV